MSEIRKKPCPVCGEEIVEDAVLCKYCHSLVGEFVFEDTEPENIGSDDAAVDDATKVFSTEDISKAMQRQESEYTEEVYSEEQPEEYAAEEYSDEQTADEYAEAEDIDYDDYNDGSDEEAYDSAEEYEEEYTDNTDSHVGDEYDPKRTFIITAIITVGILIVIIAAVAVGYKLFGFGDDNDSSSTGSQAIVTPSETQSSSADSIGEYIPQVTDDTVSENPEEILNSQQTDPVTQITDSNVDSSMTDSMADSSSQTDSATDSSADSSADSSSDNSSAAPASNGAPGFEAAGGYYSWSEADTLISNYLSANNMNGSYSYAYGTDGVEMIYSYTDDSGNTSYYRVDLQTGYVTPQS